MTAVRRATYAPGNVLDRKVQEYRRLVTAAVTCVVLFSILAVVAFLVIAQGVLA